MCQDFNNLAAMSHDQRHHGVAAIPAKAFTFLQDNPEGLPRSGFVQKTRPFRTLFSTLRTRAG